MVRAGPGNRPGWTGGKASMAHQAHRMFETGAQNGRKTSPIWAQIEGWLVSKGSRINVNFANFW
jgi:hypothetical protein